MRNVWIHLVKLISCGFVIGKHDQTFIPINRASSSRKIYARREENSAITLADKFDRLPWEKPLHKVGEYALQIFHSIKFEIEKHFRPVILTPFKAYRCDWPSGHVSFNYLND